jgi:hypothetical protein
MASSKRRISEVTRRDITDLIASEGIAWSGRLREAAFLSRLYDLQDLPSYDSRFRTAERDIVQHREYNYDWEDDWVFDDGRFRLRHGPDEVFVAFLAEMLHPAVRDEPQVPELLDRFNALLRRDGWELIEDKRLSGRPVFAGRRAHGHRAASNAIELERYPRVADEEAIREHMRRIDGGLAADPAAAVASSKELLETTCKMILEDYGVEHGRRDGVADLFKKTTTALSLRAEDVPEGKRGSDAAKKTLRAMIPLVQGLAELRNELGLGHGRATSSKVPVRYARLAFNASVTVVEFLLETWHVRRTERNAA